MQPPEAETEAAPSAAASADADEGAEKQAAAHQQPAQDSKAAGEQPAAAATAQVRSMYFFDLTLMTAFQVDDVVNCSRLLQDAHVYTIFTAQDHLWCK